MNILLVEDHRDLAEVTLDVIRHRLGHEVAWAATGAQALELARSRVPDAILVDVGLPDLSGHEVARRLRAEPPFDRTWLVALSGYGERGVAEEAYRAGFDAYQTKPLDVSALADLLTSRRNPRTTGVRALADAPAGAKKRAR